MMKSLHLLPLVCAFLSAPVAAQPASTVGSADAASPAPEPWGRLELGYDLSVRESEHRLAPTTISSSGTAPDRVRLSGAYFPRGLLGAALDVAYARYLLAGNDLAGRPTQIRANELRASGGLAARFVTAGPISAEAQLGYQYGVLPAFSVSGKALSLAPVNYHGPMLAAALGYGVDGPVFFQVRGRVVPVAFGALNGADLDALRQFGLGAEIGVRALEAARMRWNAVIGYELTSTSASGKDRSISQLVHQVGIGLRTTFPGAPSASASASASDSAPAIAAPAPQPPPPPAPVVAPPPPALKPAAPAVAPPPPAVKPAAPAVAPPPPALKPAVPAAAPATAPGLAPAVVPPPPRPGVAETPAPYRLPGLRGGLPPPLPPTTPPAPATGPGTIEGVVLVERGMPAMEIPIEVQGTNLQTDDMGSFTAERVGPGSVTVRVNLKGYRPFSKVVEIAPGSRTSMAIQLERDAAATPPPPPPMPGSKPGSTPGKP